MVLYKIGEFSMITKVSKRMLRYYDEKGLLKPRKDDENRYRYYTNNDLRIVNKIKLLRKYNFSSDEIKNILEMNPQDIKIAYQNKIDELNEKAVEYSDIIEEMKDHIECKSITNIVNTYDVSVGARKPFYALCLRKVVNEG